MYLFLTRQCMPVVQKFKRFVDEKRCKVPFFFTCGFPTEHGGLWGGVLKAHPPNIYSPHPGQPGRPYLGGRAPPSPCREPGWRAHCADSPLQWAEPPRFPPPSSHSSLLSLLGQKLGPRGGSSCRLGRRPRALRGRVVGGSWEG